MIEVFDAVWTLVSALAITAILGWIIRYFLKKRQRSTGRCVHFYSSELIQRVLAKGDKNEAFLKRIDQRNSSLCCYAVNVCME